MQSSYHNLSASMNLDGRKTNHHKKELYPFKRVMPWSSLQTESTGKNQHGAVVGNGNIQHRGTWRESICLLFALNSISLAILQVRIQLTTY